MRKLDTFLKTLLLLISIFLGNNMDAQSDCYIVQASYSGREQLSNPADVLIEKACIISDSVRINPEMKPFQIFSHDMPPVLAYAARNAAFENGHKNAWKTIAKSNNHFLLISKDHMENGQIWFRVFLQLPDIAPYNTLTDTELTAIQNSIESVMNVGNGFNVLFNDYVNCELKGLIHFQRILTELHAGTFQVSNEMWEADDWELVPIDPSNSVEYGDNTLNISNNTGATAYDYSGIKFGNNSLLNTLDGLEEELIPGLINISYGFILTGENTSLQGIQDAQRHMDFQHGGNEKLLVWLHFDLTSSPTSPNGHVRIKSGENFTEEELEAILQILWVDHITRWVDIETYHDSPYAAYNENQAYKRSQDCGFSWQFGKNCLLDQVEDFFGPGINPIKFNAGLAIGLLDGLLGAIEFIFKAGAGVTKGVGAVFKGVAKYIQDVAIVALREKSIAAAYDKVAADISETWKVIKESFVELREFVKKAITGLANNAKQLLENMMQGIKDWFGELLSGEAPPAYDIGVLAFDVIITVFSGGTGAAKSILPKLTKFFKSLKINPSDAIAGILMKVQNAAKAGSAGAKKLFRCRILGRGCFVAGTPVRIVSRSNNFSFKRTGKSIAMAAIISPLACSATVPIQDVQLFDYALAHTSINSNEEVNSYVNKEDTYFGLMESELGVSSNSDPYTSNQQRERDQYELDSPGNYQEWNEVVFEESHGSSIAKLALHTDWINQKGYQVDALVQMNLPEQGISGPFRITSIKHILPQKKPADEDPNDEYEYRPVTGLFTHVSNQVYDIDFASTNDGDSERIGVTYQHPIYSITAQAWRLAGELEIGEKVLTKSNEATVLRIEKRLGREVVYNLEVKDLHNFLVGEEGVVVHNSCWDEAAKVVSGAISKKEIWAMKAFPAIFKRGGIIEKVLRKGKYSKSKGWGFTGVGNGGLGKNNYWLIDFFKGKRVVSLKSTIVKDGSDWATSNADHIKKLNQQLKLNKFPNCKPGPNCLNPSNVIDNITEAELHIVVEKLSDISKNDWITAIKSKLPAGEKNNLIITITEL